MHWWDCDGKALRSGDREPSVCVCDACGLPLEEGDHTKCDRMGEDVTCPQHIEEEKRRRTANRPRMIAYFKRRKAHLDSTGRSTPETDRFFERIFKHLESEE
jgi:predicted sulfurtransferase